MENELWIKYANMIDNPEVKDVTLCFAACIEVARSSFVTYDSNAIGAICRSASEIACRLIERK